MSSYETYNYNLAFRRREELARDRVRNTTKGFYDRYVEIYEQMVAQGFDKVIPNEINMLRRQLNEVRDLLIANPFEARNISLDIGSTIHSLRSLGRTAIREYEMKHQLQQEQLKRERSVNKSQSLKDYYEMIDIIKDPIVRDFATDDLEKLKNQLLNSTGKTDAQMDEMRKQIKNQVQDIVERATQKADKWKQERMREQEQTAQEAVITSIEENLEKEQLTNKEQAAAILEEISSLRKSLMQGAIEQSTFKEKIVQINNQIEEETIEEDVRKEAVKAVMKSLKAQGFNVGAPQLITTGKGNVVKILAKKVSGKRAECIIDKTGKMSYKFDEYEGMTCLKDIEQFNVDLKEIYGIQLSDKRVLWENPIRISKDAKPIQGDNEMRGGR